MVDSANTKFCTNCGTVIRAGAKFCSACGAKQLVPVPISAAPAVPAPPTTTVPAAPTVSSTRPAPFPPCPTNPSAPASAPTVPPPPAYSTDDVSPVSAGKAPASPASRDGEDTPHIDNQTPAKEPKKENWFFRLYDAIGGVACFIFGLFYFFGGIAMVFHAQWAGLIAILYGVYLLWPSDHYKLVIW